MKPYEYIPLSALVSEKESKIFNVFGVFKRFQMLGSCHGIVICDETTEEIVLELSTDCESIMEMVKPGDIIRIHRVKVKSLHNYFCFKAADFVIFQSLEDQDCSDFQYYSSAQNPTIGKSDYDRTMELEIWLSTELLKVSFSSIVNASKGWANLVFQIADIKHFRTNRSVLAVYDGTSPRLTFQWLLREYEHSDKFLYEDLITINVWDRQKELEEKIQLKEGDLVVIFNLEISMGRSGNYELNLRGGSHHGKSIRKVHPNSILGKMFFQRRARLRPTLLAGRVQSSGTFSSSSPSKPVRETVQVLKRKSSEPISQTSPLRKIPSKDSDQGRIVFPVFVDILIPKPSINISQYLQKNNEEASSFLARVEKVFMADGSNSPNDIRSLIKCHCANFRNPTEKGCHYDKPITEDQIQEFVDKQRIVCLDCLVTDSTGILIPYIWIQLILTDGENKISVVLSGLRFEALLGTCTKDVLTKADEARKLIKFIHHIFPTHERERKFFHWVVQKVGLHHKVITVLEKP